MTFRVGAWPDPPLATPAAVAGFTQVSASTLGHLTDVGYAVGVTALTRPSKAVGPAFTVRIPRVDGAALSRALDLVRPGDVLVVDTSGETVRACWGGILAHAALRAGVAGVVIDGPVTDWVEITASGPPVWCRGVSALTTRRLEFEGALLVPVQVGGAVVCPGDIVLADSDGVFFVSAEGAEELAAQLLAREAEEPAVRHRLDAGERLGAISRPRATPGTG
jgi:regulator of RNase E activity RraA